MMLNYDNNQRRNQLVNRLAAPAIGAGLAAALNNYFQQNSAPLILKAAKAAGKGARVLVEEVVKTQKTKKSKRPKSSKGAPKAPTSKIADLVAPVSVNSAFTSNMIKVSGNAQKLVDYSFPSNDSARIEFSAYTPWNVINSTTTNQLLVWWSTGTSKPTGGNGVSALPVTPASLSSKLATYEHIYQRYAFRELSFCLVTQSPTSYQGACSIGYIADIENWVQQVNTLNAPISAATVLDYNPSCLAPLYSNECITMKHTGTKTWDTMQEYSSAIAPNQPLDANSSNVAQYCQGLLAVGGSSPVSSTQAPVLSLMVKGIIDFYGTRPYDGEVTPSLAAMVHMQHIDAMRTQRRLLRLTRQDSRDRPDVGASSEDDTKHDDFADIQQTASHDFRDEKKLEDDTPRVIDLGRFPRSGRPRQ